MTIIRKLFIVLYIVLLAFCGIPAVQATSDKTPKIITVGPEEVVNGSYYVMSGDTVEVLGTVNGDLYVLGGQVLVTGKVNGDVIGLGGQLNLGGEVKQNLRFGGGQINLNGKVGRNLTLVGGNLDIGTNASVGGGGLVVGGQINQLGQINGDLLIAGSQLSLSGKIGGNLETYAGNLRITPSAIIIGRLSYNEDAQVQIDDTAKIGEISKRPVVGLPPVDYREVKKQFFSGLLVLGIIFKIIGWLSALLLGWLFFRFAPNFLSATSRQIHSQPVKNFAYGTVVLILAPVMIFLLGLTLVGLPLAGIMLTLYAIYLYFAQIVFAFWLGHKLFPRISEGWSFFIGLTLLWLLFFIPVIGGIVKMSATVIGLGSNLLVTKQTYLQAQKQKIL